MSTQTPPAPHRRAHRHTRSVALPTNAAAPQHPQNPHHLNMQGHESNSQIGVVQPPQLTTPPRTPQKADHVATTQYGPQVPGSDNASKSRSRGKNRPKNGVTSPPAARNDRSTPPLTVVHSGTMSLSKPISTPSAKAYAGPTFHASPAPSALPIPSFLSKSVPDSSGMKTLETQQEETSSSGNDSPTPPTTQVPVTKLQREESPLDFFFKADREEKARARSASSFRGSTGAGPFPPPSGSPESFHNTPPPKNHRASHFSGGSNSALFAMELDGTSNPGMPYGPAFSTPYNERINAALSSATAMQSPPQATLEQQLSKDRSEALKAYLLPNKAWDSPPSVPSGLPETRVSLGAQGSPENSSRYQPASSVGQRGVGISSKQQYSNLHYLSDSAISRSSPRGSARSSGLRQEVTPTTTPSRTPVRLGMSDADPQSPSRPPRNEFAVVARHPGPSSVQRLAVTKSSEAQKILPAENSSQSFKEMEDSLRRMLKLEPVKDDDSQIAGNSSATKASVPTYLGSAPTSMNGLHNGVIGS